MRCLKQYDARPAWTRDEDAYIEDRYGRNRIKTIARKLGRSQRAVPAYHAVMTGGLAAYLGDQLDRYRPGRPDPEPAPTQQPRQTWPDSLFASA